MNKKIKYYDVCFYFKAQSETILTGRINIGNKLRESTMQNEWTIDSPEHMAFLMDKNNTFGFVVTHGEPFYEESVPNEQKDTISASDKGIVHDAINIACEVTAVCMPALMKIEALSVTQRMEMLQGASLFCLQRHEKTGRAEREHLSLEERRTIIFLRCVRYFNNEHNINLIP